MTIKYGELTIIINNKEQTIMDTFFNWINDKRKPPKYIFLFDDGIIFDDTSIKDFKFNFLNGYLNYLPLYFEKTPTPYNTYFCKSKTEKKISKTDFNNLFKGYSKYNPSINIESVYNEIYYYHTKSEKLDVFGIKHLPSGEYSHRFQFAYNIDEFTKEEISYVLHYIFNECNK
jgi:hypothetical protein